MSLNKAMRNNYTTAFGLPQAGGAICLGSALLFATFSSAETEEKVEDDRGLDAQ
jgi:hypothetical protein